MPGDGDADMMKFTRIRKACYFYRGFTIRRRRGSRWIITMESDYPGHKTRREAAQEINRWYHCGQVF